MVYSVPMNKDSAFLPGLMVLVVIIVGCDYAVGWPLLDTLRTFLAQNGF